MNKEYCFKLENLVNNLNNNGVVCDKIKGCKHTINNTNFCSDSINFYNKNSKWLLKLAEEDIGTVDDLNNYINWIGNNEQ